LALKKRAQTGSGAASGKTDRETDSGTLQGATIPKRVRDTAETLPETVPGP
jgi:hypothetical protein